MEVILNPIDKLLPRGNFLPYDTAMAKINDLSVSKKEKANMVELMTCIHNGETLYEALLWMECNGVDITALIVLFEKAGIFPIPLSDTASVTILPGISN